MTYVIPSIDIRHGRCVKLVQGRVGSGMVVSDDPVSVARMWEAEGAKALHVVDLDGALEGRMANWPIVRRVLKEVDVPVEVGGGIRSPKDASKVIGAGARWVILGTVAVERPELVKGICEAVGPEGVILALESRKGTVVARGWAARYEMTPLSLARRYEPLGVAAYLYTAVDVEGTESGIDAAAAHRLVSSTRVPVIYSGGVSSLRDVAQLARIGVRGIVVGSALYRGRFALKEAEEVADRAAG
ncbi:TPA: 1-(5-phosphoribosyl)-5-[(5-phosphoribosylamino)methylideneamino]imidazole-4-carboxamide isomerase [Candidatus Bathyarchaeota archaeon]|nr:1-(5-phosphoribosyl)-5-[(5-phosphoribosylamino)methylideneamino]imidazole-4-carboxamide isomerase [Candidatus Bathyarchaeota archaeon]